MFTVIKLGGVNGSGKTSVARSVMDEMDNLQECGVLLPSDKRTKVYLGRVDGYPVVVLGKYDTACGGMDTIGDKHDRQWLIETYAKKNSDNIILAEGLITGKTYGALGRLSEAHVDAKVGRWLYAFMDTPFDVAVERVLARRQAAGNAAPFDPERTMRPTYESCTRLADYLRGHAVGRVEVMQQPVLMLNHKHKPARLAKALLEYAIGIHRAGF